MKFLSQVKNLICRETHGCYGIQTGARVRSDIFKIYLRRHGPINLNGFSTKCAHVTKRTSPLKKSGEINENFLIIYARQTGCTERRRCGLDVEQRQSHRDIGRKV